MKKNSIEVHQQFVEPWRVNLVDTGEEAMNGGLLKRIGEHIKDEEAFFFTYGYGVSDINIASLVNFHREHKVKATLKAAYPPGRFGPVPFFVDIDPITYNIFPSKIEEAISPKTKAIMLAHSLGNPFNLDVVVTLSKKHNLWLIEDCCEALGTTYNRQIVGTFGDIATLSFYPAHHITMGEGGAVFTNNYELKQIAESYRDWGRDCYCPPGKDNTCGKRFCWKLGDIPEGYDHKYTYSHLGYNLKITDMQAACALLQLKKAPAFIQARKDNCHS